MDIRTFFGSGSGSGSASLSSSLASSSERDAGPSRGVPGRESNSLGSPLESKIVDSSSREPEQQEQPASSAAAPAAAGLSAQNSNSKPAAGSSSVVVSSSSKHNGDPRDEPAPGTESLTCDRCKKQFKNKMGLHYHFLNKVCVKETRSEAEIQKLLSEGKGTRCDLCQKYFKSELGGRYHKKNMVCLKQAKNCARREKRRRGLGRNITGTRERKKQRKKTETKGENLSRENLPKNDIRQVVNQREPAPGGTKENKTKEDMQGKAAHFCKVCQLGFASVSELTSHIVEDTCKITVTVSSSESDDDSSSDFEIEEAVSMMKASTPGKSKRGKYQKKRSPANQYYIQDTEWLRQDIERHERDGVTAALEENFPGSAWQVDPKSSFRTLFDSREGLNQFLSRQGAARNSPSASKVNRLQNTQVEHVHRGKQRQNISLTPLSSQHLTDTNGDESVLLHAGSEISAIAWAPARPLVQCQEAILAVATREGALRHFIQIWSIGLSQENVGVDSRSSGKAMSSTDASTSNQRGGKSRLSLLIHRSNHGINRDDAVTRGFVSVLSWCPWSASSTRLGILCAISSVGALTIFALPRHLPSDGRNSHSIYGAVHLRMNTLSTSRARCIDWNPVDSASFILGRSDGFVGLWRVNAAADRLDNSLASELRLYDNLWNIRSRILQGRHGVTSVSWNADEHYLFASSTKLGDIVVWDARETRVPLRVIVGGSIALMHGLAFQRTTHAALELHWAASDNLVVVLQNGDVRRVDPYRCLTLHYANEEARRFLNVFESRGSPIQIRTVLGIAKTKGAHQFRENRDPDVDSRQSLLVGTGNGYLLRLSSHESYKLDDDDDDDDDGNLTFRVDQASNWEDGNYIHPDSLSDPLQDIDPDLVPWLLHSTVRKAKSSSAGKQVICLDESIPESTISDSHSHGSGIDCVAVHPNRLSNTQSRLLACSTSLGVIFCKNS